MEQKEMLALLKSQMHMTYAERNEIAVHMNALSERLHQQEADIEKLVQERGTMRASSPTMEWISVEEDLPKDGNLYWVYRERGKISLSCYYPETKAWGFDDVAYWMTFPGFPKKKVPTFKDVFLKEFPKAETVDGRPAFCVRKVFPYLQECNFSLIKIGHGCKECWNQPYFEPKEEGEAMREILFRGKKESTGDWVFGDLRHYLSGKVGIDSDVLRYTLLVDPETVGQYTGLKDKNGVKIFEGDIIKIPNDYDEFGHNAGEIYEIYFCCGGFRLKPKYSKARGYWIEDDNTVEVIGNIHDNPELLKEGGEE